jgi:arabinofuranosyltransferase
LPEPQARPALSWKDRPIAAEPCVGVVGWELPELAIIDRFGLNDAVIARGPARHGGDRRMAHDRQPPAGYIECFEPNVHLDRDLIRIDPRALSDERIRACEREYRQRLK